MIRIKAPEGYLYFDQKTGRSYSEVVIDAKDRDRFVLVPAFDKKTIVTY